MRPLQGATILLRLLLQSRAALAAENLALRQQFRVPTIVPRATVGQGSEMPTRQRGHRSGSHRRPSFLSLADLSSHRAPVLHWDELIDRHTQALAFDDLDASVARQRTVVGTDRKSHACLSR
jgi:hypothetical protein